MIRLGWLPVSIGDALVRGRFRRFLRGMPFDRYRVRIARRAEEYADAFQLVRFAYAAEGFESVRGPAMRINPQHVLPEATVFVAYCGEEVVGTLTVTSDSPAGLPLDADYRAELDSLRAQGSRLVEYGAEAVSRRHRHTGAAALLCMAAHWYAEHLVGASHVVAGVNPRAMRFYRAIYRFVPLGAARPHVELHAPVQGMVQDIAALHVHLARRFPRQLPTGLYLREHCDYPPSTIEVPDIPQLKDFTRWKLPRAVFRKLFIEDSDRLLTLDHKVRAQLDGWRSIRTTATVVRGRGTRTRSGHNAA